jgi:C4-dicarboxylate-specific signal transduction histidine kinase
MESTVMGEVLDEAQQALARPDCATTASAELSASIAYELSQPLCAIVASAAACARWLSAQPPNLEKARRAVERIANEGGRAGEIIDGLRLSEGKR